jgi:hypothetical protein
VYSLPLASTVALSGREKIDRLVHCPTRDIELSVVVEENLHFTGMEGIAVRILTEPSPLQLPPKVFRKPASAAWAVGAESARAAAINRTRILALLMTYPSEHEDRWQQAMRPWLNWHHVDESAIGIEAASERVAPLDRPLYGGGAISLPHRRSRADTIGLCHVPRS